MEFYTYLYLREDGTPYYVGKGKDRRAFHIRHNVPVPSNRERILIQEFPSEDDAIAAEIFLISYYGRKDNGTGILRNFTDGGDGTSGRKHLDDSKQQTRNSLLGRKHTEERRKNQSLAHKGKSWTEAQRAARPPITHCKRGHLLTPETVYLSKKNCRGCKACQHLRYTKMK